MSKPKKLHQRVWKVVSKYHWKSKILDFIIALFWTFWQFFFGLNMLGLTYNHIQTMTKPSHSGCFLKHFWPIFGQKYQKVNGFDLRIHIPWTRTLSGLEKYLSQHLGNSKNIILFGRHVRVTAIHSLFLLDSRHHLRSG